VRWKPRAVPIWTSERCAGQIDVVADDRIGRRVIFGQWPPASGPSRQAAVDRRLDDEPSGRERQDSEDSSPPRSLWGTWGMAVWHSVVVDGSETCGSGTGS
jgi:hypothetical protein